MQIGKIVKSNSHVDYVCQINNPGEFSTLPQPQDYAFGTFVRIELGNRSGYLVGLIYSTILMNPEFGSLGPRLSPPSDLEIFSPDYLREQATLVNILAVGQVMQDGEVHQGVPWLAATVNAAVEKMSPEEIRHFHTPGGRLALAYVPRLLAERDAITSHLLLKVVEQLIVLFPGQRRQLAVLRGNLAWKAAVTPAG
ncbi:MAG: hypothetical protein NZ765_06740 [Anaerolineae bacterium]|nr:hypothetical protein [Anaerolineae bacterium]MDW8069914.1 hypothetical protein [Anaerolineae bacterium]